MALGKLSKAKLPPEVNLYIGQVRLFLASLDVAMQGPSSVERGKSIAKLSNALEMATDQLAHFGIKERKSRRVEAK